MLKLEGVLGRFGPASGDQARRAVAEGTLEDVADLNADAKCSRPCVPSGFDTRRNQSLDQGNNPVRRTALSDRSSVACTSLRHGTGSTIRGASLSRTAPDVFARLRSSVAALSSGAPARTGATDGGRTRIVARLGVRQAGADYLLGTSCELITADTRLMNGMLPSYTFIRSLDALPCGNSDARK
jgi:hypothetical protein